MSEKTKDKILTILCFTIFIACFLLNILLPNQEMSVSERRKLRQFPTITWDNLISTKAMEDFDKYTLDQFVGRDSFRWLKATIELRILLKKDNNDLFIYDDYIFKNLYPLNEEGVKAATKRFNYLQEKYLSQARVFYAIIPDKNYYLPCKAGYLIFDYGSLVQIMNDELKGMEYIDIFDTLNLTSYYKTDIHWQQQCLQAMVERIAQALEVTVTQDYQQQVIADFQGAYQGQLAITGSWDNLVYLTNAVIADVTVYNYENGAYSEVYDLSKLISPDKYDIFLSGPLALLRLENPHSKTEKQLIVFRDSFGSSLIPLLIQDYREIIVIDLRYVSSDYLAEVIDFVDQDVLFIYSVNILNNGAVLR